MSKKTDEKKVAEFVRNTRIEERLRIQPAAGHTIEEIFELLEANRVDVVGHQLLLWEDDDIGYEDREELGTVLLNNRVELPKPWRQLSAGKVKARAAKETSADKPAVVRNAPTAAGTEDLPKPAHTCNSIGSPEHLKFQADQLRYRSEQAMQQEGCDLLQVALWLSAAEALLTAARAVTSVEGVWLLASRALLADKRGNVAEATKLLDLAVKRSDSHVGHDHPCTVGLVGNYGQYLIEHGDRSGITILEATLPRLKCAKPAGNFSQEWIDGAYAEFASTLATAEAKIAAYYGLPYQPPVAEAVCDAEAEFPELYTSGGGFGIGDAEGQFGIGDADSMPPGPPLMRQQTQRVEGYTRHPGSVWMEANWDKLPPNEWFACTGQGIVAHDPTDEGLWRKLAQSGLSPSAVAVAYNEPRIIQ